MPPDADPQRHRNLVESLAPLMGLPDRLIAAALDQMAWHLICCHYLLGGFRNEFTEVLGAAVGEEFLREATSGISELRVAVETAIAEIAVRHFDRMVCSTADSFQDRLDVLCDPENILFPSAEIAPQCHKVGGRGVRQCTRPVIYIGGGEWSQGCEAHACSADQERHKQWQDSLKGTAGDEARLRQARQLAYVANFLLEWWPTAENLDTLIREALGESPA